MKRMRTNDDVDVEIDPENPNAEYPPIPSKLYRDDGPDDDPNRPNPNEDDNGENNDPT
jgi:hypothetical protein